MDSDSSFASQAKAPVVISQDSLISPLYEVISPFFTPKSSSNSSSSSTSLTSIPGNSNPNIIAKPMVNSMGAHISPFLSSTRGALQPCHSPISNRSHPGYFMSLLTSDIATLTSWFASKCHYSYSSSMGFPHFVGGAAPRLSLQSFDTYINPCYFPGSSASSSPHALTNSKCKYMCGACQVYFSTSQALGGHMSYHSKERKEQPLASTVRTTVRASSSSKKKKEKRPWMLNRIAYNALENDEGETNAKSQSEKKRSDRAIEEERKKEKACDAEIFKPQQVMEDEKLSEMINEMYYDMDFNYFVGNN